MNKLLEIQLEELETHKFVTSRSKKKSDLNSTKLNYKLKPISDRGIDLTYNLTNTDCSTYKLQSKYDNYLCFTITYRTNKWVHYQNDKYSDDQKRTYELIKSLHDEGWGYRRITKHLNNKRILTHTGKTWGETGNSVYSVLKKYKEREERLELI